MDTLKVIKKYWLNTPELFSEKYKNSFITSLSPVNWFLLARRRKTIDFAGLVKNQKILDVGCGSGVFMIEFIKKGAYVIGADYSQKMLDLARRELSRYKVSRSKYKLLKADATNLPFKNAEFDLILAAGLADYLTDERNKKFIKEAARVLKDNGRLIIGFPCEDSPFAFLRSGPGLWLRQNVFKLPPIHNTFSIDKIDQLLALAGLQVQKSTKVFSAMWLIVANHK